MATIHTDDNPLTTPRVLVIGLGSTGGHIVDTIIDRMEDLHDGGMKDIPWLRVLVIETENKVSTKPSVRTNNYHQIGVPSSKISEAKMEPSNLDPANDFQKWTIDTVIKAWQDGPGAGNMRMIGRARLLHPDVLGHVIDSLAQRIEQLKSLEGNIVDRAGQTRRFDPQHPVDVFICGTLVGGTGSGSMIDLGYILRQHSRFKDSINLIGLISVPGSALQDNNLKANAYQALTELAHFDVPGTQYAQRVPLPEAFPGGFLHCPPGTPPLDSVFLIQPKSTSVANDLRLMISSSAELINSFVMSQSSSEVRAKLINPTTRYAGVHDRKGLPQRFSSIGVSIIEYPVERIARGCGARLASEALERWLRAGGFEGQVALNWFTNRLGLTAHTLVEKLTSVANEGTSFTQRAGALIKSASERARVQGDSELSAIEQGLEIGFDRSKMDQGQVKAGEFVGGIQEREQVVTEQTLNELRTLITELITDGTRGVEWVDQTIQVLKTRLRQEEGQLDQLVDGQILNDYKDAMDDLRIRLEQAQSSFLLTILGWRGVAVDRILDQYEDVALQYWQQRLQQKAALVIQNIYASVNKLLDKVDVRLSDENFGLKQWAEELQRQLHALYLEDRDEPVNINGYSDFATGEGQTLDQDYAKILGQLGLTDRLDIAKVADIPTHHQLVLLRDWDITLPGDLRVKFLEHALLAKDSSPFDRETIGEGKPTRSPNPAERQDVIRRARKPFWDRLRLVNISERLVRMDKLADVANAVESGSPFIRLDDINTTPSKPTGNDARIPNFAFMRSIGEAESAVFDQIRQAGNWGRPIESDTPYRITMIRARACFAGNAVVDVAAYRPFWKDQQGVFESRSRKDVRWRALDGSEPIPQYNLRMSTVLMAIGLKLIPYTGGFSVEFVDPSGRKRKLVLSDSIDEAAIRIDDEGYSKDLADMVRGAVDRQGHHQAALQLANFAHDVSQDREQPPMTWHGSALRGQSEDRAIILMRAAADTIPEFWPTLKRMIQRLSVDHFREVPEVGFVCHYCGVFLGDVGKREEVANLRPGCPSCGIKFD